MQPRHRHEGCRTAAVRLRLIRVDENVDTFAAPPHPKPPKVPPTTQGESSQALRRHPDKGAVTYPVQTCTSGATVSAIVKWHTDSSRSVCFC